MNKVAIDLKMLGALKKKTIVSNSNNIFFITLKGSKGLFRNTQVFKKLLNPKDLRSSVHLTPDIMLRY